MDKPVSIFNTSDPNKVIGTITLCQVLYGFIHLLDRFLLFIDFNQGEAIIPVKVVIPNIEVATDIIELINANPAVFLTNYLRQHHGMSLT